MKLIRSAVASIASSLFALVHGAVPAPAAQANELQVAPANAIVMVTGGKSAIGYYLAENGNCNLTVLLSDVAAEDGSAPSASRINFTVAADSSAQVDTVDGASLQFTCAGGASKMLVTTIERPAFSRFQKTPL